MNGKAARRYARALLDIGGDPATLETWGAGLEKLAATLEAPEVQMRFAAPDFSHPARVEAMDRIAERLELGFPVRSLAVVIARHGRIAELRAISDAYQALLDDRLGRARAALTFARPPGAGELQKVVDGLAAIARKTIIPTVRADQTLLGGVVAELGGKIYDGSLATMIAEAQRRLAR